MCVCVCVCVWLCVVQQETVIGPSAFVGTREETDRRALKVGDVMERLEGVTLYDLHSCLVQPPDLDSL